MYNYYQQQPNSTMPINPRPNVLTHAAMFSYQVLLTEDQEELLADIISTYGNEIIMVTNKVFKKIKGM